MVFAAAQKHSRRGVGCTNGLVTLQFGQYKAAANAPCALRGSLAGDSVPQVAVK